MMEEAKMTGITFAVFILKARKTKKYYCYCEQTFVNVINTVTKRIGMKKYCKVKTPDSIQHFILRRKKKYF